LAYNQIVTFKIVMAVTYSRNIWQIQNQRNRLPDSSTIGRRLVAASHRLLDSIAGGPHEVEH
jgi:hypothetical protein